VGCPSVITRQAELKAETPLSSVSSLYQTKMVAGVKTVYLVLVLILVVQGQMITKSKAKESSGAQNSAQNLVGDIRDHIAYM